jgi:nitrite reductase (NADH) small subunit
MTGPKTARLVQRREHVVASVDEILTDTTKLVPIGRNGVGVYNLNGTFYAIATTARMRACCARGAPPDQYRRRVDARRRGRSPRQRVHLLPLTPTGFELATGTTAVSPSGGTLPVRVVDNDALVIA